MLAYEQWQGFDIVPMPAHPGLREVEWGKVDTIGSSVSPYTRQSQFQEWVGGDYWQGSFTLPQMTAAQWAQWDAWDAALRGQLNVFRMGHPLRRLAGGLLQASGSAGITLQGPHAQRARVLHTRGWKPNLRGQLLRGDHLQVGPYRLHMVTADVNADSSGFADIALWPTLRDDLTGAEVLNFKSPQGLFRLVANERQGTSNETRLTGYGQVKFVEAR